jgi:hypothetical protein
MCCRVRGCTGAPRCGGDIKGDFQDEYGVFWFRGDGKGAGAWFETAGCRTANYRSCTASHSQNCHATCGW